MRQSKAAVEDYLGLDIRWLARKGLLNTGCYSLTWTRSGKKLGAIDIEGTKTALRLSYAYRGEDKDYQVKLVQTPCNYGGTRTWFLCPLKDCGRRVAKLFGGAIFACRHCHQLNYKCQQLNKTDQGVRQGEKLRERLDCRFSWVDIPAEHIPRPKGMHRRTHTQIIKRLMRYEAAAEAELAMLDKTLAALGDPLAYAWREP